jgi:hypothetical protein
MVRPTTPRQVEVFGVVEFAIPAPPGLTPNHHTRVLLDNRVPCPVVLDGGSLRFRFSPRDAKRWRYIFESDFAGLQGLIGWFTATPPPVSRTSLPSHVHPNWWIDDPSPAAAEGIHPGAKTVNQWRTDFLEDFSRRIERCVRR